MNHYIVSCQRRLARKSEQRRLALVFRLVAFSLLFISTFAKAHEPANLVIAKHELRYYHDSGAYQVDIANILHKALCYLEMRVKKGDFAGRKPAIVLDIDETSLSNYPYISNRDFGGTEEDIRLDEDKGLDKAIKPTLKLYRFAKEHHVAVFFITGRLEKERAITADNLKKVGFLHYDGLIMRSGPNVHVSAAYYKKSIRKQLIDKGYDIILNIGDQLSDLRGGYADIALKLPNPYYFIP